MRAWWWVAVGVGLVVGAVAVMTSAPAEDFGWFAYTPSDDSGPVVLRDRVVMSSTQAIGCVVAVAGLLVMVGGAAYRRGRRAGQSAST